VKDQVRDETGSLLVWCMTRIDDHKRLIPLQRADDQLPLSLRKD
jgi:hypothetical protein